MTRLTGEVLRLLRDWLPLNDAPERPQVQLATVDADGAPDLRTVLLSEWDEGGFAFHTDSASRKAAHLRRDGRVALAIVWRAFTRQLVIRGRADRTDGASAALAYARRSPYLQQLAWQNTVATAALPADERRAAWAAFARDNGGRPLDPAPTWAGFVVRPESLTFWESDALGPSHRVEFTAEGVIWRESHLPG